MDGIERLEEALNVDGLIDLLFRLLYNNHTESLSQSCIYLSASSYKIEV
jgi:hypothetical protein